jgi:hypothetical protein
MAVGVEGEGDQGVPEELLGEIDADALFRAIMGSPLLSEGACLDAQPERSPE